MLCREISKVLRQINVKIDAKNSKFNFLWVLIVIEK